jgi:hypothetical protein
MPVAAAAAVRVQACKDGARCVCLLALLLGCCAVAFTVFGDTRCNVECFDSCTMHTYVCQVDQLHHDVEEQICTTQKNQQACEWYAW